MKNNSCSISCVLGLCCSEAGSGLPLQINTDVEQGWLALMTCLLCTIRDIIALYILLPGGYIKMCKKGETRQTMCLLK